MKWARLMDNRAKSANVHRSVTLLQFARLKIACAVLICASTMSLASDAPAFTGVHVGVYYFPGWSSNIPEAPRQDPWQPIRKYPERLPAAGEYSDSAPSTLRRQLNEMASAKLSFVVFDTYTSAGGKSRGDQAINAYLKVATNQDPKFAIMWANHDNNLGSYSDWDIIITRWINQYLKDKRYLRVADKPVVFIFSPENLEKRANSFGATTDKLLSRAQQISLQLVNRQISFVAGGGPRPTIIKGRARAWGYAALTDYNMGTSEYPAPGVGYDRRVYVYGRYWQVYRRDADLPVVLPMTSGWDKSPWGGSKEDGALPSGSQLQKHVEAGVSILEGQPEGLGRLGVICCWNEYGEGSVLEPTQGRRDELLKAVATGLRSRKK